MNFIQKAEAFTIGAVPTSACMQLSDSTALTALFAGAVAGGAVVWATKKYVFNDEGPKEELTNG